MRHGDVRITHQILFIQGQYMVVDPHGIYVCLYCEVTLLM